MLEVYLYIYIYIYIIIILKNTKKKTVLHKKYALIVEVGIKPKYISIMNSWNLFMRNSQSSYGNIRKVDDKLYL